MIGRVYINELGSEAVVMDFSSWPAEILDPQEAYGFAYGKTIDSLGIDRHDVSGSTVILKGSSEAVRANIPKLCGNIGLIARYGAELDKYDWSKKHKREWIGRMLGELTQRGLPTLPADASFKDVAVTITHPFAYAANDPKESFYIIENDTPWWYGEDRLEQRHAQIAHFLVENQIS